MIVAAGLAAAGGVIAWLGISDDALQAEPKRRGQPPVAVATHYSCALAGPPQQSRTNAPEAPGSESASTAG
jgi:hypothetical protein